MKVVRFTPFAAGVLLLCCCPAVDVALVYQILASARSRVPRRHWIMNSPPTSASACWPRSGGRSATSGLQQWPSRCGGELLHQQSTLQQLQYSARTGRCAVPAVCTSWCNFAAHQCSPRRAGGCCKKLRCCAVKSLAGISQQFCSSQQHLQMADNSTCICHPVASTPAGHPALPRVPKASPLPYHCSLV